MYVRVCVSVCACVYGVWSVCACARAIGICSQVSRVRCYGSEEIVPLSLCSTSHSAGSVVCVNTQSICVPEPVSPKDQRMCCLCVLSHQCELVYPFPNMYALCTHVTFPNIYVNRVSMRVFRCSCAQLQGSDRAQDSAKCTGRAHVNMKIYLSRSTNKMQYTYTCIHFRVPITHTDAVCGLHGGRELVECSAFGFSQESDRR